MSIFSEFFAIFDSTPRHFNLKFDRQKDPQVLVIQSADPTQFISITDKKTIKSLMDKYSLTYDTHSIELSNKDAKYIDSLFTDKKEGVAVNIVKNSSLNEQLKIAKEGLSFSNNIADRASSGGSSSGGAQSHTTSSSKSATVVKKRPSIIFPRTNIKVTKQNIEEAISYMPTEKYFPAIEQYQGPITLSVYHLKKSEGNEMGYNATTNKNYNIAHTVEYTYEKTSINNFNKFIISGVNTAIRDRTQIMEHFTGFTVNSFGESVRTYNFSGVLRSDTKDDWWLGFENKYHQIFGVDALLSNEYIAVIIMPPFYLEGYLLNPTFSKNATNEAAITFSFNFIATKAEKMPDY